MVFKRCLFVLLFISIFSFSSGSSVYGSVLTMDGRVVAELLSDLLFLDPSSVGIVDNNSSDRGGIVIPSYHALEFTRLNLNFRFEDKEVRAFFPFTLGVKVVNKEGPDSQMYVIAQDYLNIPYYVSLKGSGSPFSFNMSSFPVGSEEFGFLGFSDTLGVGWSPNSLQPIMTFQAGLNTDKLGAKLYVLFDQHVASLPSWEKFPEQPGDVGGKLLNGIPIKDYGFVDEQAQYNFLSLEGRNFKDFNYRFLYGQKFVDNPSFRIKSIEEENSDKVDLKKWGYLKENIGLDFNGRIGKMVLQGEIISSNVQWREYANSSVVDDAFVFRRWYPYENRGELSGNAINLYSAFNNIEFEGWIVEPSFQAVGAVHGQFPTIDRWVFKEESGYELERRVEAIYDPLGYFTKSSTVTSPVIDYLGKRVLRIAFTQQGSLADYDVSLKAQLKKVDGVGEQKSLYTDPRNQALLHKNHNELSLQIQHESIEQKLGAFLINRDYVEDDDYYRNLGFRYGRTADRFELTGNLNKVWRLRDDDSFGEGSAIFNTVTLNHQISNNQVLALSSDFRSGNYDSDIIKPNNDRVLNPYTYFKNRMFLQRTSNMSMAEVILAVEIINLRTDIVGVESGTSLVTYSGIKIPLKKHINIDLLHINVKGPKDPAFSSNYLNSLFHQEVKYEKNDMNIRLGCTSRLGTDLSNVYASFTAQLGAGRLSLGYGKESLPTLSTKRSPLPGTIDLARAYTPGYEAAPVLWDRPWEQWANYNFINLWGDKLRSTEKTWENCFSLGYSIDF